MEPTVRAGDQAPGEPTLGPLQRAAYVRPLRGPCTQWATTGAPDAFCGTTRARKGSGTQGANPGALAAQRRCLFAPRGSSTQWATAGAPEAHYGKEWWARQGKDPLTKPGWAEPKTMARSQCSVKHPGHRAGAHATRNQQGTRCACATH